MSEAFTPSSRWAPITTVGTLVKDQDRWLMVEEYVNGKPVIHYPAGHVEPAETPVEAAIRETLEETGYHIRILGIVGIYIQSLPPNPIKAEHDPLGPEPDKENQAEEPSPKGVSARKIQESANTDLAPQMQETTRYRYVFAGEITDFHPNQPLDSGIIGRKWMSMESLNECERLRTAFILEAIKDYEQGNLYPIELIRDRIGELY